MWEDNGRRVLLRVSWYTIDVYTFRFRRAQTVVAHNLSEVQSRENLKGRIKESTYRNDWEISTVRIFVPRKDDCSFIFLFFQLKFKNYERV